MIHAMTTVRYNHISRTKINLGIGEVTTTIPDRLLRHDKIHPSRISVDNLDRIHLTIQCLIVSKTKIRAKIYLTKRSSRPPMMGISQTYFDSLQQTIPFMNYLDYAPQTNRSQTNYPDSQSVLTSLQALIHFNLSLQFYTFYITSTFIFYPESKMATTFHS